MSRGLSKINIVILHGWGLSGSRYIPLQKKLENLGYNVFLLDFPGFGSERLKKPYYILDDYVKFLDNFLSSKNLSNTFVIGHSFGGRVVTKYIATRKARSVKGIILTGAPLIKQPLTIRKKTGVILSIIGKSILSEKIRNNRILREYLYRFIGERDYLKSGELRDTFVKIIEEDLEVQLSKITLPTLIIWGENDKITPLQIGSAIHKKILNSKIIINHNAAHGLPYEDPDFFSKSVDLFIKNLS